MAFVKNYKGYDIHKDLTGGRYEGDKLVDQSEAYRFEKDGEASTLTYDSLSRIEQVIDDWEAQDDDEPRDRDED